MAIPTDRNAALVREARAWGQATKKKLLYRLAGLQLIDRLRLNTELELTLSSSVKSRQGEIERISLGFARHGIFLEHGVGKGRPVGSSQALTAARPWLKPVLDPAVEELAELLAEQYADIAVDNIRILVPGIIDTKISR